MREHTLARRAPSRRSKKHFPPSTVQYRISRLEPLEPRCVLASPTLASLSDVTLYAGTTLNVALDGADSDGDSLTYSVSSSNSSVSTSLSNSGNRSLKIEIEDTGDGIEGTIVIQLFEDLSPKTTARIIELVNQGLYDGLSFHRIIEDFMIQGGDPEGTGSGGSGTDIDDEYSSSLQFTSSGLVAMAKSDNDTGDSQFFITTGATRWLDYHHTIFGTVTEGYDLVDALDSVSTDDDDAPVNSVIMTSVTVIDDNQNGVLRLTAADGVTGTSEITVTATDSSGNKTTQSFTVTVATDTATDSSPYLESIDPIVTTIDTPVTFTIPGVDPDGDTMVYSAEVDSDNADNGSNISASVDSATGKVTITPAGGVYGVFSIVVRVADTTTDLADDSAYSYDSQVVPVYVTPAAPVLEQLLSASDSGSSDSDSITKLDNSSSSNSLTFRLSGLMTDAQVTIYAGDKVIATTVATGDTMDIETNGSLDLADGTYAITAVQTLADQTVDVGNLSTTADLDGPASNSLTLTIDTAAPTFLTSAVTHAGIGAAYVYNVGTDDENNNGATYELLQAPSGMTIDSATGTIQWTPTADQAGSHSVVVQATDAAGNTNTQAFTVKAATGPIFEAVDTQVADQDSLLEFTLAASGENTPLTYSLGSDAPEGATINASSGLFQWTPTASQAGATYTVVVYATDAAGLVGETEVEIVVRKVVTCVVAPGGSLSLSMATSDSALAGQTVTYSVEDTLPDGMAIDADTGQVTWTVPSDQAVGTIRLVVRATSADDATLYSEEVLAVTVARVPELQPLDPDTVAADASGLSFQVEAVGDTSLSYSLVGDVPDGLSIDSATGVVTWTPTSQQSSGQITFAVRVQDTLGQADQQTYTFVWQAATTGSTVSVSLQSSDSSLSGGDVEYAIVGDAPEGMTIDAGTGQVTWTVPADFPAASGSSSQAVVVVVRATASQDGQSVGFDDQILAINVSQLTPVVDEALDSLIFDMPSPEAMGSAAASPSRSPAPLDVAASAIAFAEEKSDLLGAPPASLAGDAVPASPLGSGDTDLFGFAVSEVATHGDNSAAGAARGKEWEEVVPKKRLEENASPDKRAAAAPSVPEETQQAQRRKPRRVVPMRPNETWLAEAEQAPREVTTEPVDASAVDAVVQAISDETPPEAEVSVPAQSEEAEPTAES